MKTYNRFAKTPFSQNGDEGKARFQASPSDLGKAVESLKKKTPHFQCGEAYKTEGIILKRLDYGEADRIITIFTKHHGKLRVLAKGVRRLTSRKSGSLELFNQVRIFVDERKGLGIVTEVELVNSFKSWRKDLKKVALAYQFCELVDKLTPEKMENEKVYELLREALFNLSQIANLEAEQSSLHGPEPSNALVQGYELRVTSYELSLLEFLGFWPKGKPVNIDLEKYIESLIEKRLVSKKFLKRV